MSDIHITWPHALGAPIATARIRAMWDDLRQRSAYFEDVEPVWAADGKSFHFAGDAFTGQVGISEQNVTVELTLQGMMVMFRPLAEQKLREKLALALGPGAGGEGR